MKKSMHLKAKGVWFAAMMLVAVCLLLTSSFALLADATGTVSGTVTDSSGAAISGVKVTGSDGSTAVTGSDGVYTLTCNAPSVLSTIRFVQDDYWPGTALNVQVNAGQQTKQDMTLSALNADSTVTDDFNRADNTESLGTTTDSHHYAWNAYSGDGEQIKNNKLLMTGSGSDSGPSLTGFSASDIDVEFDGQFASDPSDFWAQLGVAYRDSDTHKKSSGYNVWLWRTAGAMMLQHVNNPDGMPEAGLPSDFDYTASHHYHVRALGNHHQVWVDNTPYIDFWDTKPGAFTTAGNIVLFHTNVQASFDNLVIKTYTRPSVATTVSGTVLDDTTSQPIQNANVSVGGLTAVTNVNGAYSISTSLVEPVLLTVSADAYGYNSETCENVAVYPGVACTQNLRLKNVLSSDVVYDTFSREGNSNLGTTEDASKYLWVHATGDNAVINNQSLYVASGADSGPTISGFYASDFDASFKGKLDNYSSQAGDSWTQFGISYRAHSTEKKSGYQLAFMAPRGIVLLQRDGVSCVQADISQYDFSQFHSFRVKAIGNEHQLWIDDTKIWDWTDTSSDAITSAGTLMFFCTTTPATFDDIAITRFLADNGKKIVGKVLDAKDATPVKGIHLVLNGKDSTSSADDGSYEFDRVTPGDYTINASDLSGLYTNRGVSLTFPDSATVVTKNINLLKFSELPTTVITDTFNRDDNTDLGTTEDTTKTPWVETAAGTPAAISNKTMLMSPCTSDDGAYLGGGFAPANIDAKAYICWNAYIDGQWAGITYRQPSQGFDGSGYRVLMTSGYHLQLLQNTNTLADVDLNGITSYDLLYSDVCLEVKAMGNHHQVFVNGDPIIDVYDSTTLDGGYFGFIKDSANQIQVSDFSLTDYSYPTCTISGTVSSKSGAKIAGASVSVLGNTVKTGDDGAYTLTVSAATDSFFIGEQADLNWTVVAEDYKKATLSSTVTVGDTLNQDFVLDSLPAPVSGSDAKKQADGSDAYVKGLVVTGKFKGCCYAEDINRTSGIKILGEGYSLNDYINLEGTISTVNGEKCITPTYTYSKGQKVIAPLGTAGRSFATGLSNKCLLMKTWGKVTYVDPNGAFMYVDDGSNLSDGNTLDNGQPVTGIKVVLDDTYDPGLPFVVMDDPNGWAAEKVAVGDSVAVAGISETVNNCIVLLPRDAMDISKPSDQSVIVHPSDMQAALGYWNIWTYNTSAGYSCNNMEFTSEGIHVLPYLSDQWYFRAANRLSTYDTYPLSKLTSLKFAQYMIQMPSVNSKATFSIQIRIDTDDDGSGNDILVYDPYSCPGGATLGGVTGTWQVWDAIKNGLWWCHADKTADTGLYGMTQADPKPLSYYLQQQPNAKLCETWMGSISVNVGANDAYGYWQGFEGILGSMTVGTQDNGTIVYSFAPDPATN